MMQPMLKSPSPPPRRPRATCLYPRGPIITIAMHDAHVSRSHPKAALLMTAHTKHSNQAKIRRAVAAASAATGPSANGRAASVRQQPAARRGEHAQALLAVQYTSGAALLIPDFQKPHAPRRLSTSRWSGQSAYQTHRKRMRHTAFPDDVRPAQTGHQTPGWPALMQCLAR